jgi:hypothetical protein
MALRAKRLESAASGVAAAAGRAACAALLAALLCAPPARADQIRGLPGEDISGTEEAVEKSRDKVRAREQAPVKASSWLAPSVDEQLSRDRTMIPLGKGALFVPAYSEGRREPEISILNARGRQVGRGETGERVLLDSGDYRIRFGSGTASQQIEAEVHIEEGHTTVVPPAWSGLIVEVLTSDGEYLDGQYELILMDRWVNYGKGRGLTEERLQDIKTWVVPPGMYRLGKTGEGLNSLRNYITVQLNPGELKVVELIMDKSTRDIVSGGVKSLNTRQRVGKNWTYGLRAGGNIFINRETDKAGVRKENVQFLGDLRTRANYDNVKYWGTTELVLKEIIAKERNRRYTVTSDEAQVRSTWVRRLNTWLGPYLRGTVDTHLFPKKADQDTILIVRPALDTAGKPVMEVIRTDTTRSFESEPSLDPFELREGLGVNVDFLSRYYLEASAQFGFAGRQNLAFDSYLARTTNEYEKADSKYEIGAETNLLAVFRLGDQATVDLRTEVFFPNANPTRFRLDEITADCRIYLSRYVEIGYVFQLQESVEDVENRYPRTHSFSLRFSLNY